MSLINQFVLLAEYNQLMNNRLYLAASNLSEAELCEDKGAYFKSVLGTLNHIIAGDIIWLKRFSEHPSCRESLSCILEQRIPKSLDEILFTDFGRLREEREKVDGAIISWAKKLNDNDISDCITYTNMAKKSFTKSFESLINHLFLHQVHHRGQVTTLLSQYDVDFGDTDIIELISECNA